MNIFGYDCETIPKPKTVQQQIKIKNKNVTKPNTNASQSLLKAGQKIKLQHITYVDQVGIVGQSKIALVHHSAEAFVHVATEGLRSKRKISETAKQSIRHPGTLLATSAWHNYVKQNPFSAQPTAII